jgi:hypothetical protein
MIQMIQNDSKNETARRTDAGGEIAHTGARMYVLTDLCPNKSEILHTLSSPAH